MTFGPKHYVPVLKTKRGEKAAMQAIASTLRPLITPLWEVVSRKEGNPVSKHVGTAIKGLATANDGYSRCFLDAREIASDGPSAAAAVFTAAARESFPFTPVTGISRTSDVTTALSERQRGLAIRLVVEDFERGSLPTTLLSFLNTHALRPCEVDLLVDLGDVHRKVLPGVQLLVDGFLAAIPSINEWRTLTITGCDFPLSLAEVERESSGYADRTMWQAWFNHLHERRASISRLPSFSDNAIQHTKGVEGFDFRTMHSSAAIRYALDTQWLLIKGISTKLSPPSSQFPTLATSLVSGDHRGSFRGARHCAGCESIVAAANGAPSYGAPEVWRRIGTIHHVTMVAHALCALPSS